MPSARRRRFSVKHDIAHRDISKSQNETQVSQQSTDIELQMSQILAGGNNMNSKNKLYPNTSKRSSTLEIVAECKSTTSTATVPENRTITSVVDKEVTARSSNIDIFTILNSTNSLPIEELKEDQRDENEIYRKSDTWQTQIDKNIRRDKHPHRIKVRSPKRKAPIIEQNFNKRRSIAIGTVACINEIEEKNEVEVQIIKEVKDACENTEEEVKISSHSMEDMCRICHSGEALSTELGQLISACSCRGTVGRVHVKCLERWLTESGKSRCELCGTKYLTRRIHKFGILKAIFMWMLSNNAKHMIVDFFGIMIMTPIALVAAGLTGRTFAGLMAQDQMTPWPLASTFVLACMTLVCYYCWIVSALTRHSLGWWVWYRSHYEVRLQLEESEN